MLKIPFWSKETGNLMSHKTGLTPEQIEYLKQLKVGDRLIMWFNKIDSPSRASYNLKVYHPAPKNSEELPSNE